MTVSVRYCVLNLIKLCTYHYVDPVMFMCIKARSDFSLYINRKYMSDENDLNLYFAVQTTEKVIKYKCVKLHLLSIDKIIF